MPFDTFPISTFHDFHLNETLIGAVARDDTLEIGVSENRDKEPNDPRGRHHHERLPLLGENGRAHFTTRRFDRDAQGRKFHIQSLCGMAHFDFNQAGAYSYEQAFQIARRLGLPQTDLTEMFRRAVFNVMSRNQDDHTKNIAFIMNRSGKWRLAPAFDLIHAYNPDGAWPHRHQMTLHGKRDDFLTQDLLESANHADLRPPKAKAILRQVHAAVADWRKHAEIANVPPEWTLQIQARLRLGLGP